MEVINGRTVIQTEDVDTKNDIDKMRDFILTEEIPYLLQPY
jgi:hypothetical protein